MTWELLVTHHDGTRLARPVSCGLVIVSQGDMRIDAFALEHRPDGVVELQAAGPLATLHEPRVTLTAEGHAVVRGSELVGPGQLREQTWILRRCAWERPDGIDT